MGGMRLPSSLRRMDDRVLGDRLRPQAAGADDLTAGRGGASGGTGAVRTARTGKGAREAAAITARVSKAVLLLLALVVLVGVVFTLAPTNAGNVIVRNALGLARDAAGPFRDVFTVAGDRERELVVNYLLAAVVYGGAGLVVGRLGRKSS